MQDPITVTDPATPDELLALAKHLASDPSLEATFRRVGLHTPFARTATEYWLVIASREAFAPPLHRLRASLNLPVAEALARRIFSGVISSDADGVAFIEDRFATDSVQITGTPCDGRCLLESEIKDVMRNLSSSPLFAHFERCKAEKEKVMRRDISPYDGMVEFIGEQMWLYGLGARGWSHTQIVVLSFMRNLWFDKVPDLSPATVERMLQSHEEFLLLPLDQTPRKG